MNIYSTLSRFIKRSIALPAAEAAAPLLNEPLPCLLTGLLHVAGFILDVLALPSMACRPMAPMTRRPQLALLPLFLLCFFLRRGTCDADGAGSAVLDVRCLGNPNEESGSVFAITYIITVRRAAPPLARAHSPPRSAQCQPVCRASRITPSASSFAAAAAACFKATTNRFNASRRNTAPPLLLQTASFS